ncbi:MAG: hypothetical protein KDI48_19770 [Xanthomonadales bacterium]|nr:hypothetical protein [Xanthomonadales bacterium]
MGALDYVQWPAMVATLLAAWLVASKQPSRRDRGFWVFLLSNLLWVIWAVPSQAWALVVLQIGLAFSNVRGVIKNRRTAAHSG